MPLDRHKTVRQALQYVERHPEWPSEQVQQRLDMPIWEMVARNLFDIANKPDTTVVGSMAKATKAQKIILDRLTGTRRAGTHPAVRNDKQIKIRDLTTGLPEPVEEDDDDRNTEDSP